MSYTLTTATTAVRNNLNETTAAFWLDSHIQTWIQEGTLIFSSATLMYETSADITLVANTLTYNDLTDCIEPYGAYYDDGSYNYKGLIKAHPRMLGHLDTFTAGPPKYYMFHNRLLYLWPLSTATEAGDTVKVLYSATTNDITDLADEYQIWPIIYATAKGKERDRKFQEAGAMMAQFYTMVNFERQDKHAREIDSMDKFLIPVQGQGPEGSRG